MGLWGHRLLGDQAVLFWRVVMARNRLQKTGTCMKKEPEEQEEVFGHGLRERTVFYAPKTFFVRRAAVESVTYVHRRRAVCGVHEGRQSTFVGKRGMISRQAAGNRKHGLPQWEESSIGPALFLMLSCYVPAMFLLCFCPHDALFRPWGSILLQEDAYSSAADISTRRAALIGRTFRTLVFWHPTNRVVLMYARGLCQEDGYGFESNAWE